MSGHKFSSDLELGFCDVCGEYTIVFSAEYGILTVSICFDCAISVVQEVGVLFGL